MPSEPAYDVVWPLAPRERRALRPAPRPDGLNGKTIGFLWNGLFKGDRMFELMKEVLAQRGGRTRASWTGTPSATSTAPMSAR